MFSHFWLQQSGVDAYLEENTEDFPMGEMVSTITIFFYSLLILSINLYTLMSPKLKILKKFELKPVTHNTLFFSKNSQNVRLHFFILTYRPRLVLEMVTPQRGTILQNVGGQGLQTMGSALAPAWGTTC